MLTLGPNNLASVISQLYLAWQEREYIGPGSFNAGYVMAVLCMAQAQVPWAQLTQRGLESGCTLYGASINAIGLGLWVIQGWLHYSCALYGATRLS